ncbi:GNAT family N-acetyltransferase [Robertmurraya sp.]|uniref:GNAT family N-acetyltransferase n=1 Tax=Robertmurraya sp. TaxID=2837525 RepID=UPI0037048565
MFQPSTLIHLRKTTIDDLDFIDELESDPQNAKFIIPWSAEKHISSLITNDILHIIIEEKAGHTPVGYLILAGLTNPNQSIELVRITIREKGKGYGKEAFRLVKDWVFTKTNANRLWLDVKTTNDRAVKLYEKQGFTKEGTLRECLLTEGTFESLHIMAILKREFFQNKK